jgi:hypothetical protein
MDVKVTRSRMDVLPMGCIQSFESNSILLVAADYQFAGQWYNIEVY